MTSTLFELCFGARDPQGLARFWAGVLERDVSGETLLPGAGVDLPIRFAVFERPRTGPNQMHFDLTSSSLEGQAATVARALDLGASHLDIGQLPDEKHVVLADPEGNEFCVIEPGNNFLADTARIGALSSDGSEAVGRFWAAALDWPLVWDQDEETAIQSPRGGSKISWGGPPVAEKTGPNRLFLELVPIGTDQQQEAEHLVALGAVRARAEPGEDGAIAMADPDGNEFRLLPPH